MSKTATVLELTPRTKTMVAELRQKLGTNVTETVAIAVHVLHACHFAKPEEPTPAPIRGAAIETAISPQAKERYARLHGFLGAKPERNSKK